ncbi:MAG: GxxExxY protein [Patescibacteria group bacterium]
MRNTNKSKSKLWRKDLVYPELSYQIVGILFEVYNQLGSGFPEKVYQRAVAQRLRQIRISFSEQVPANVLDQGEVLGRYFLDFLIEYKLVLELKRNSRAPLKDMQQVLGYLKATGLQLGILADFTSHGVQYRRILNLHS